MLGVCREGIAPDVSGNLQEPSGGQAKGDFSSTTGFGTTRSKNCLVLSVGMLFYQQGSCFISRDFCNIQSPGRCLQQLILVVAWFYFLSATARNGTRTIPRQKVLEDLLQTFFPHKSMGWCQNLSWLCLCTPRAEAPPVPCPKLLQSSRPKKCWVAPSRDGQLCSALLLFTVKYLPLSLSRAFLKAQSFTENAQELRDWSQLFQQDLHILQAV